LEITEEKSLSLPIEDLFNSPEHTELLNKFLGIIKEDKFEATAAKTNPGPKIEELFNSPEHSELQKKAIEGLEITEEEIKEAFSLPIEDLFNRLEYSELLNKSNDFAGAGPKSCESCEEALKGLWKFFKKFENVTQRR
jgi:hypothetical protein